MPTRRSINGSWGIHLPAQKNESWSLIPGKLPARGPITPAGLKQALEGLIRGFFPCFSLPARLDYPS
jgi:hypothetical protein